MVVYADLLFLLNLAIDGAVLLTTAWVRGVRPKAWRLLGAASIGASYVLLLLLPPLSLLSTLAVKIPLSLLMLYTAFGFSSLQYFLANTAAFYGVNFAAAGGVYGMHYMLLSSPELWRGLWFVRTGGSGPLLGIGGISLTLTFAAAIGLYRVTVAGRRRREQLLTHVTDVEVLIEGTRRECRGLIDTGNQLYDPLTRTPVMVMEASLFAEQLPASWQQRIKLSQVDQLVAGIGEDPCIWQDRLRLIPYRGVNRGAQFMLALKPDRVRIEHEGKTYETRKVLIGLDGGTLAADGAYRAIVHPSLMAAAQPQEREPSQTRRETPKCMQSGN
ncbi:sigma-E processing peptidase SpoIIGA [Paenibacillus sp. IB182496]|uniref:Sigma-E processing peptidase SpoIIGA n=1 Tax=Paenibacillus sabuli TaxID=2772509 RepID=A0A927BT34_9BACL|nr:sigma-E processing peptidase SpoIIGA [Paenibacillus sabuli]MBD2846283.1 sigma-E processing peptidase SpoIIGA [Paenibacillus sabuli]